MVQHRVFVFAAMAAALMAGGCTTGSVDKTKTTAIAPLPTDVSQADLAAGKTQFRDANYGLAEKHFRKAVELRADNAEAWMGLAAAYDQLGRFDFADRAYEQLLQAVRPQAADRQQYGLFATAARQQEEGQGAAAGSEDRAWPTRPSSTPTWRC